MNTDQLIVTAVINFLSWNLLGVSNVIKSQICVNFVSFWRMKPILKTQTPKNVLVCKMRKNDVITSKLSKTIELIKYVCVKYKSSTKWATQGNKEQIYDVIFAGSESDSNRDQLIKTAQGVLDWLKIYPNLGAFHFFLFSFCFYFILFILLLFFQTFILSRTSNKNYNPTQIWRSASVLATIMLYFT